jgi:mevalonate kinase
MKAIAEAPSKVIITGEHFVVHGAWALAAALPRPVRVLITPSSRFEVVSDRFRDPTSPQLLPVSQVVEAMAREFSVKPNVRVNVASAVPGGAGLGSSASTMVAVASAYSKLNSLGLGVDEIIRFSMIGERRVHGKPSGIDSTICSHGGVLLFRPGSPPRKLSLNGPRSLIISYSGMGRTTRGQIGKVSRLRDRSPETFSMLVHGVSELSLAAAERLREGDMKGLGRLLTLNHAVLGSVGVSNKTLDEMVGLMGSLGCYGAKLTGAGGGGSVLAVAPEAKEKSIVSGLSARGFETFRVRIPVGGVKNWLEP